MQLSFYNWKMMDHLSKGLGTYSFALHLRSLPRNFISHFLLSRWLEVSQSRQLVMSDGEKYQALDQALRDFWFVGAHSDCDRVIAEIGADLGVPPMAAARNTSAELQAHTGWRLVTATSLSSAEHAAFRAKNTLDLALWDNWGTAGFEPAKVAPAALDPKRKPTALAHEIIRPWFRLQRFVRREWIGRRQSSAGLVDRANRARDAGVWALAARRYREALQVIPDAPAIWVQYGHALKESGRVGEAEQAYRRSLRLNPDIADTHLQLGHALKLQRRVGEAESAYLRAAMLDPAGAHARNELIAFGWPTERIAEAIRASAAEISSRNFESG
jgi:tetratricopeptide (TPR) repeat protein